MIIGLACGAAASALLHSTLASPGSSDFLYGVRFYDPWTFAGISSFLIDYLAAGEPGSGGEGR